MRANTKAFVAVAVPPFLTFVAIEIALRIAAVRDVVIGSSELPALVTSKAADPALLWLEARTLDTSERFDFRHRLEDAKVSNDVRAAFIVGDSTCEAGVDTSAVSAAVVGHPPVHRLCVFWDGFGGAEAKAELLQQLPTQTVRSPLIWIGAVANGVFADTPPELLDHDDDPLLDLGVLVRSYGSSLLRVRGLDHVTRAAFRSKTAIGRYSGVLPYRLSRALVGESPPNAHFVRWGIPDDVSSMFPQRKTLDQLIDVLRSSWDNGDRARSGFDQETIEHAKYRGLRAVAAAARERNFELILVLLPTSFELDEFHRRANERFGGSKWLAYMSSYEVLWSQIEAECAELHLRCLRADATKMTLDDFETPSHFSKTGRAKLLDVVTAAASSR